MTIMSRTTVGCWEEMAAHLFPTNANFQEIVAKALKEAVEAEQDRCAKIAEYCWQKKDPLLDVFKKPTDMAYFISTNIRALRRPLHESRVTKRKQK